MKLASAKLLDKKGIDYSIIELTDRAVTVEDVVRYAKHGVDPDEICKTIIIKDREGRMHAVFLRGGDRIDFKKLRRVIGKASVAVSDDVEEATGVKPGAVCPLTLDVPLYVDERVLMKEYGIELSPNDLAKVIDFMVVDAAKV